MEQAWQAFLDLFRKNPSAAQSLLQGQTPNFGAANQYASNALPGLNDVQMSGYGGMTGTDMANAALQSSAAPNAQTLQIGQQANLPMNAAPMNPQGIDWLKAMEGGSALLSGAAAAGSMYTGLKNLDLQKRQFRFQKDAWNKNYANQLAAYNRGLEDKARSRNSFNPAFDTDNYINEHKLA